MLVPILKAVLPKPLRNALRRRVGALRRFREGHLSSTEYWTRHHVAAPDEGFATVAQSLDHLDWRNRQYPGHTDLMPVDTADGLAVLDYGCGPGNDIVGFGTFSKPSRLVALDVSATALDLARRRAALHGINAEFHRMAEERRELPLDDASIDLIHSAGVLHHTPDPLAILREFRRVLKPNGSAQIMVYNRDSLWMHLHVVYEMRIANRLYRDLSKEEAFARTTDGEACPIARCYRPHEFLALAREAGLEGEFLGSAVSLFELMRLPKIYEALKDPRLDLESRTFLSNLQFNDKHWPLTNGCVAGINGYFRLRAV
ncbi:MAG: class I SAM-dependent methyltransferase [Pseudomonadota bacterium]